eukprot:1312368-Heterocapsa_arctica.AAC.1
MPTRQTYADRKRLPEHRSTNPTAASSSFDPAAAMPNMRAPGDLDEDRIPGSKRQKNIGDVDLDDDDDMELDRSEPDAATHVLLSSGMGISEARRTVAEMYSPPQVTDMAQTRPSLGIQPGFALDLTVLGQNGRA